MNKFISYPSIEQYRNVIRNVKNITQFVKLDENGEAVFNRNAELPKIQFEGTVKLHGTNASVCGNKDGDIWAQSRNNIITPENDNAGFAKFVESNKNYFKDIINILLEAYPDYQTVVIFGEWCGAGIQKNVGIS